MQIQCLCREPGTKFASRFRCTVDCWKSATILNQIIILKMKNTALLVLCLICSGVARAQLNWYAVDQIGMGNQDINGKATVNKWAASHATISIDLQNSNIYIYDAGKSEHYNVVSRTDKVKSLKGNTKTYNATNENGTGCKICLWSDKFNKKKAELSVYLPDKIVYVYKITKRAENQPLRK